MSDGKLKFDEIGYWSEIKLDIIREYATAYSTILTKQTGFSHVYIDGFSGPGVHVSKATGEFIQGSPLNALAIQPPFTEHFLIDLDGDKIDHLRGRVGDRRDVHLLQGDCNQELLTTVFPQVQYEQYRRGLCLLDPYGLHLNWEVIETAGGMRTLDMFLNFPTHDINRNALWRDPDGASPEGMERMTKFWGDDSWREIAYQPSPQLGLFGEDKEKVENEVVARAFCDRLREVAGFKHVHEPMPMRNTRGAVVYYLMFASQKSVPIKIVNDIFKKYADRTG